MSKLAMAYAMKKRHKMAEGGEMSSGYEEMPEQQDMPNDAAETEDDDMDGDMLDRIMRKHYSEGGMVANDDGVAEADKKPAEYDDLVLRDGLEGHDTEADSGDDLGNKAMGERDSDIISRIMRSMGKKDRMPRPA